MVHEVGHGLHFSEAAADIAFVTKNALALRDAHSNESKTVPFKSIQASAMEDARAAKQQNGNVTNAPAARGNGNNIFSYNASRNVKGVGVAEAPAEPYDDDCNFEKDSAASFDFNRHRSAASGGANNVVGPLTKPTPSKWDDAEKWLSAGESALKPRPKNSPLSAPARKGDGFPNPEGEGALEGTNGSEDGENGHFDGEDNSPEKCTTFMSSKKSLLPRFAFMPGNGKPVPLPLPVAVSVAPVDRYPLEDVFCRDESNAKESSDGGLDLTFSKAASRTAKPTAGVPAGKAFG
jgi:hypothetical protein